MPHRPEGQVAAPGGVGVNPSVYTPPRVAGSAAAAIMRQNSHQAAVAMHHNSMMFTGNAHGRGVVTPLVSSKPWVRAQPEGMHGAMMPSLDTRKSADSTDRSTGTNGTKQYYDEDRSVATLATESEDREATASALLMVARAAEREQMNASGSEALSSAASAASTTAPLKKRKKTLDILRRKQQGGVSDSNKDDDAKDSFDPCHVSPVSHSSAELLVGSRTASKEDETPPRRLTTTGEVRNSTNSYDSKDPSFTYREVKPESSTQELLDSSKVHSTAEIAPTAQVLIPHFPTVLHQVLSDKEFDGKVVQWLPDGESWKVLRWDALRRQILPRYFADLRDENGSGCGTIDAFLFHLGAWGFEEIKDGTDVGAYRHDLFIRGAQKLCVKMRFTSDSTNSQTNGPKTVSPNRSRTGESERSMLQVPSLASLEADLSKAHHSNKRPRYESQLPSHGPLHWPYNETPMWGGGQFGVQDRHHLYGMRAAVAIAGQYPSPSSYDPRIQLRRPGTPPDIMRQTIQYSPPQVRSGRGAMRAGATRAASPMANPIARQSFPVSNRGKGSLKPAACRPLLPTAASPSSEAATSEQCSPKNVAVDLIEAQRIGSTVQGVAIAISRKTKRKLPLAGSKKADEDDAAASNAAGCAPVEEAPKSEVSVNG